MTTGGIILCGGKSTRMGRPKAGLPFGEEVMLQRIVRILKQVVSPIAVVAASNQELPALPAEVLILRDEYEALGPLAGLAAGLEALRDSAEAAYVSSCDVPLLDPAFIRSMIDTLGPHDMAIPFDGRYHHPLAAVYRTALVEKVRQLISQNRLRPVFLFEGSDVCEVDLEFLKRVDPELRSLRNVNTPKDYEEALRDAGFGQPSS